MTPLFTDPFFFGDGSTGDYLMVFIYAVVGLLFVFSYFLRAVPPFKQIWWFTKFKNEH